MTIRTVTVLPTSRHQHSFSQPVHRQPVRKALFSTAVVAMAVDTRQALANMTASLKQRFSEVKNVTVSDLQAMKRDISGHPVVLIDVRTEAEREVSRIPGAISEDEFWQHKEQYWDHIIVPYCTIGYRFVMGWIYAGHCCSCPCTHCAHFFIFPCDRSSQCCKKLASSGVGPQVFNLEGGILAWTHEQLPLETGENVVTKEVHVFGSQWELQGEGYTAVKFDLPLVRYAAAATKSAGRTWFGFTKSKS